MVAIVLCLAGCADGADKSAVFYQSDPPPAGAKPGMILRSEPLTGVPFDAKAWRILYVSTGLDGKLEALSGIIIVPPGSSPTGGRAIVAWGHSTTGVAAKCAPSMNGQVFATIPGLPQLLAGGYVVVATDYPGLGVDGTPSYLIGISEGRALLDSVRAAGRLLQASAGRRYVLWGHSQGGHAALFAGQIASNYAPDLQLVGVAAAAPPTNLALIINDDLGSQAGDIIGAYALWSWSRTYGASLKGIVADQALPAIDLVASDCARTLGEKILVSFHAREFDSGALVGDPSAAEPWRELLSRNSPGQAQIRVPLLITQGDADDIVSPRVTAAFVHALCHRRETVQFMVIAGGGHMAAGTDSAAAVAAWIRDRFQGSPAPNTCTTPS